MSTATLPPPPAERGSDGPPESSHGGYTLEASAFLPRQGDWTEAAYLDLGQWSDEVRCELVDGELRLLAMPTWPHQLLQKWIEQRLSGPLGFANVTTNGYRLRVRRVKRDGEPNFRLPDVIASAGGEGFGRAFATAATLVVEIISDDPRDRERDLETKRRDYAEAGVPEYWVVDPEAGTVAQFVLEGGAYREAGTFGAGQTLVSAAVEGVTVPVDELFAAAKPPAA